MVPRSHSSNFENEDFNPCRQETKMSQKCLEINLYRYEKCAMYFENYKNCNKFWASLSKKRRNAGISPNMPGKEEREKIIKLREEGINVISAD